MARWRSEEQEYVENAEKKYPQSLKNKMNEYELKIHSADYGIQPDNVGNNWKFEEGKIVPLIDRIFAEEREKILRIN